MQGWHEQHEYAGDAGATGQFKRLNGDDPGRKRARPQRPPTMARVTRPPTARRVARPSRDDSRPINRRRRLLIWLAIFIACIIFACFAGYALENLLSGINTSANPAGVATDFLGAMSTQNYNHAYDDLAANLTVQMSPSDFARLAQATDRCYGKQTNYTEIPNSAALQNNSQSYSYNITRSQLHQPYTLRLTLTQDSNNNWKISSFGANNILGPAQPLCN